MADSPRVAMVAGETSGDLLAGLLIDGMQCAISSLDLQLLYLLWEKKGECVNREDLKTACWPHDPQADEKLDAHIQTIRKVLQDFPDYRISTAKGRGYYLTAASC